MLSLLSTRGNACVASAYRKSRRAPRVRHGATGAKGVTKAPVKIIATALAVAIAASSMAAPASAFFWKYKYYKYAKYKHKKKIVGTDGSSSTGPIIVGCVMGSAFGLIVAALMKQNEHLTVEQAQAIAFSCGLGFFPVVASFRNQQ